MSHRTVKRPLALALMACALAAPAARAAESAAETTAGQDQTDTMAQIQQWIAASKPVDLDESGAEGVVTRESPRKVHGEAGVAVGTGGYSSAYVASLFPVGETGTLGIAVSQTRMGSAGRFAGPAYGYGDGTRQSVAMSLALGDAATGSSACRRPAFGYDGYTRGFGPPPGHGFGGAWDEPYGDPGAAALARTACREAQKNADDWRD